MPQRRGQILGFHPRDGWAGWDGDIHPPLAWSADSKAVYFAAEEDARARRLGLVRGWPVHAFELSKVKNPVI